MFTLTLPGPVYTRVITWQQSAAFYEASGWRKGDNDCWYHGDGSMHKLSGDRAEAMVSAVRHIASYANVSDGEMLARIVDFNAI